MDDIVIQVEKREILGKRVSTLRRAGQLPAIIYGTTVEPIPISMDAREASRTLARATSSSLVRVQIGKDEYHTLVREKQRDKITGDLLHVDFQVVLLTETVRASVDLQYDGESPALKTLNAILVSGIEYLDVEGLPQELPNRIMVDISGLEDLGDTIYVRDLPISPNITVLNEPDEMVVLVTGKEIEEEEELEEEMILEEGEEPEVIERGKRVEEEEEDE